MPRGKTSSSSTTSAIKAPSTSASKAIRARKQPERLTEEHTAPISKSKKISKAPSKVASKSASKAKSAAASKGKKHAASPTSKIVTKRATKGSKRSFPSMVAAAISTLHTRGGSSYQAIEAYISQKHPEIISEVQRTYQRGASQKQALHGRVMRALHRLEADGQVDRHGHSYRLTTKAKRSPSRTKMSAPAALNTTRVRKSKKHEKDPNAPKRALTPYMFFANDVRATVKAEQPSLTFGQLGAAIAERWAKATPAEKKKYEAMALKDKERYIAQAAAYVPPAGSAAAKKLAKAAKPKRAPSEWNIFLTEEGAKIRAENPGIKLGEVAKIAGERWEARKSGGKSKAASKKAASPPPAAASKPAANKPAASKSPVKKPASAPAATTAASKKTSKTAKK